MGYRASTVVGAPAEDVWGVLSDVTRWPDWSPTMTWVRPLDDTARFGEGSQVRIKQPRLPVNVWTVRRFDAGRSFTWTTGPRLFVVHGHHEVLPVGADRCQVTLSIEESGPLAFLVRRLFRATNRHNVDTELQHLRHTCEQPFGPAGST